jgi:nicotinamide-nucleotide amidase
MLGVKRTLVATHGAVSEDVACAMAKGALAHASADVAVATTGIAGPGGGTAMKPVGLVHIAVAGIGRETHHAKEVMSGDRGTIRMQALEKSLSMLERYLSSR